MSWEMHEAAKKIADGWYSELEAGRKRNAVLGCENAKLREQVERLRTQLADMTESVGRVEERCAKTFEVGKRWMAKAARFEAENAKLRELVMHLYEYRQTYFRTGIYPTDHGVTERRMQELGVEVDE